MTQDLTDVMARLLLQKVIEVGELSQEDANAEPAANLGDKTDDPDEVEDAEGMVRLHYNSAKLDRPVTPDMRIGSPVGD